LSVVIGSVLEGALKEAGKAFGSGVVTGMWGVVTSFPLGGWTWFLKKNPTVIPGDVLSTPTVGAQGETAIQHLANQIFSAWLMIFFISFVLALVWLYLVRLHRPSSPLEAVTFRRYWLAIAALLLGFAIAFYGSALYAPPLKGDFSQIRDLKDLPKLLLFVALLLSAFLFFYVLSVLRSPPTVISAVPFGSFFARLRWS
jgi:hypothetical protein